MTGKRVKRKDELSGGRIIIASTKITPTDSSDAVSTKHRININPYWTSWMGMPKDVARLRSKLVTSKSL